MTCRIPARIREREGLAYTAYARRPARELPFRDAWFDLVFTVGLLIHIPEESLPLVMSEVVRTIHRSGASIGLSTTTVV
jgi:SAM-dependent methyltransferase